MNFSFLLYRTARKLYEAEAGKLGVPWDRLSDDGRAVWLRRAKTAVQYAWPEIARQELLDAAEEIDWQFEVFTASDGVPSIRMHGKSPSQLLEERADKVRPEESYPDVGFNCANDGDELVPQWDHLRCPYCGREYTLEGRPLDRNSTHMKRAVKRG